MERAPALGEHRVAGPELQRAERLDFGLLFLRDGTWDGPRILPEGWVDYGRTRSPQSEGLNGAHFWVTPGSLGIFSCQGAWGQRILIVAQLDPVIVRLGQTSPHKVGAV